MGYQRMQGYKLTSALAAGLTMFICQLPLWLIIRQWLPFAPLSLAWLVPLSLLTALIGYRHQERAIDWILWPLRALIQLLR